MTRTADALDRLRAADPLGLAATSASATTSAPARRPRRPRQLALSVAAVTVVGAVAFVLLPGGAADPSDARAVDSLLAAGRAAATAVDVPLGPGQLVYSRVEASSFGQVTRADGSVATYLQAPRLSESWIAHEGALTRLEIVVGRPTYFAAGDSSLATDPGKGAKGGGSGIPGVSDRAVVVLPASPGSVNGPTYDFARTLPTEPAALEQRIRQDTAGSGESADVEVWVTVRDMLLSPVSPPALRAALYQVAAALPGVEYLGPTTDRLGRRGVAVALSHGDAGHARSREVMVFDPTTGLLLQTEERAIDPAQFGLPASMKDAVVGWAVWVRSGIVDAVGLRPDGTRVDLTSPASPATPARS